MEFKHVPIMLKECIDSLDIKPNGTYVDATIGGAGHSAEIVKRLNEKGVLIGIDKDETAINVSKQRLSEAKCKVFLVHDDFINYKNILSDLDIEKVDGILMDLGVSSHQIDEIDRGFSYKFDASLDMRMDKTQSLTAEYIVNNYDEQHLLKILYDYGEENFARKIVNNIIFYRNKKPITTTQELVKIIEKSVPASILHKGGSVAKKTFQALRIEVNGEINALKLVLDNMISSLSPTGRICIISFHSLEDRIVKNNFKENSTGCICPKIYPVCVCHHVPIIELITKKPITPTEMEIKENSRCTSSKLRVAEKL